MCLIARAPAQQLALSLALLLGLLSVLGASGVARATIFEADDREVIPREPPSPFAAVGVVEQTTPGRDYRFGSATLIGPCHVLTAYHVAFRTERAPDPALESFVHFGPAKPDGFPFSHTTRAKAVVWGDYVDGFSTETQHPNEDWAVLRLDDCLGEIYGQWPVDGALDFESAKERGPVFGNAGHPAWLSRAGVWVDPACAIHLSQGSIPAWWNDCATSVGTSGGPVFYRDANGQPVLVAVVRGQSIAGRNPRQDVLVPGWSDDGRGGNVAIPVMNFIERIQLYIGQ